ncbi:YbgA family protein [Pontibacter sp. JAM-7]|uniref:YbgA family protein n=1 Tax=Pontibacter sp. JAM-7 TaxID=3366581 RepID=UPI003AF753D0
MAKLENSLIPVGISACLMGQKVRFDGGHKRSRYCLDVLSECFEFKSFCPEVAVGLGTPREPIRLVDMPQGRRVVGTKDPSIDVTDALKDYAEQVYQAAPELCGYILMKGSPSCGMERVKVYHANGNPNVAGSGLYAERLMQLHPALPVEEEGRLQDAVLRENFITRVFVYHDWKTDVVPELSLHKMLQFHSRHKYQLMAHHYQGYRVLGRFLAQEAPRLPVAEAAETYLKELMAFLRRPATRKTHSNVLMHIMGYLKKHLDSATRHDLLSAIEDYRTKKVHLVVPLSLLQHYLKRYGSEYILSQAYLNPYPHELGLRNYI